ncbi:MAG: hypothetical protein ABIJ34_04455 [archaeon]
MIKEELEGSSIILLITQKSSYKKCIGQLYDEVLTSPKNIGYVTINKPYNTIISDMKLKNIDSLKLSFVDAITATVQAPPIVNNCMFVSSPTALTDLGLAYSSLYGEHGCNLVLFDTISTLIVYQDLGSVTKFVHNLVTKARVLDKKLIMIGLKEDSENLIKDLNMFVDKVIDAG